MKNLTYLSLKFRHKKEGYNGGRSNVWGSRDVLKLMKPQQDIHKENFTYIHYSTLTKNQVWKFLKTARRKEPMTVTRAATGQKTNFSQKLEDNTMTFYKHWKITTCKLSISNPGKWSFKKKHETYFQTN